MIIMISQLTFSDYINHGRYKIPDNYEICFHDSAYLEEAISMYKKPLIFYV
jgi:hypothetical protein